MNRGSYKIQDGYSGSGGGKGASEYVWEESTARSPGSSHSACLLATIFFLFLCVIIFLAAWPWNAGKPTTDAETDGPIQDGLSGEKLTTVPARLPINISPTKDVPPLPTTHSTPTSTGSTTSSVVEVLPVEGRNNTNTVDRTMKKGTHEALEVWKEGNTTFSGEEERDGPINDGLSGKNVSTVLTTLPLEKSPAEDDTPLLTTLLSPNSTDSTTVSMAVVLPVEGRNDTDIVGITMTPGTYEALEGGKDGSSISSEDESKETELVGGVCWSPDCKAYASQILALMNHSADPCNEMYAVACGGMRGEGGEWIAENLNDLKPMKRIQDMLHVDIPSTSSTQEKFTKFIDKCIHFEYDVKDKLEKAKGIIDNVGMFLLRESENGSISDLLANLLLHNFPTIFDIQLESQNTESFILKISLPEFKSPLGHTSEDDVILNGWKSTACSKKATEKPTDGRKEDDLNVRYTKYIQCNSEISKYIKEVEEALKMLKLFQHEDEILVNSFINETVFFLEKELLKEIQGNLPSQIERNSNMTTRLSKFILLGDLQYKFSLVDWEAIVRILIGDSTLDFLEDIPVNLYYESYFEYIFGVLQRFSLRQLYNGLLAMFAHEIYYGLVLNRNSCFREEYCFAVASELMPEVASYLFLRSFHKNQLEEFKLQINYIYTLLKSQMQSEVEAIIWLKDESKKRMLTKISEMRLIDDGGCPLFLDNKYLEDQFKEHPLNSTYIEDAVSLMQRLRKKMYGAYGEKPLKEIWSQLVQPHSTKPKAFYEMNAIVIPYGVMLQQYSTSNSSRYLQMATVGSQIAKVIWQHFDGIGIRYDSKGSTFHTLGTIAQSSMRAVTDCMERQLQTEKFIEDKGITVKYKLPESLSINSRLADVGGIHLAFNAMMKDNSGAPLPWLSLSKEQLYFLTIAQSMCSKASVYQYAVSMFEEEELPPFLRIEDMVQNSQDFTKAYNCDAKKIIEPACMPFTLAKVTKAKNFEISH